MNICQVESGLFVLSDDFKECLCVPVIPGGKQICRCRHRQLGIPLTGRLLPVPGIQKSGQCAEKIRSLPELPVFFLPVRLHVGQIVTAVPVRRDPLKQNPGIRIDATVKILYRLEIGSLLFHLQSLTGHFGAVPEVFQFLKGLESLAVLSLLKQGLRLKIGKVDLDILIIADLLKQRFREFIGSFFQCLHRLLIFILHAGGPALLSPLPAVQEPTKFCK